MSALHGWPLAGLVAAALLLPGTAGAASVKKGYAMCRDQGSLRSLVRASVADDAKAVAGLMKRSCAVIKAAQKVKVLGKTETMARIQIPGRGTWWTVVEAVQ